MSQRVGLVLSDEALAVIAANATERKRGEFVSNVLVDYARVMDSLRESEDDEETGLLGRLRSQMARLEKQMALLLNKLEGWHASIEKQLTVLIAERGQGLNKQLFLIWVELRERLRTVEILIAEYQKIHKNDKSNWYAAGALAVLGDEAEFLRNVITQMEKLPFDR